MPDADVCVHLLSSVAKYFGDIKVFLIYIYQLFHSECLCQLNQYIESKIFWLNLQS